MSKEILTENAFFSQRLESLMNPEGEKRIRQAELAEKIGVAQSTVHSWIAGKMMPGSVELMRVAQVFGVTMESLLCSPNAETEKPATKRKRAP